MTTARFELYESVRLFSPHKLLAATDGNDNGMEEDRAKVLDYL